MVETGVEAYDAVDDAIDMLTGVREALRLRANGGQERDEHSLMLAEVVYAQVESLHEVRSWLDNDAE